MEKIILIGGAPVVGKTYLANKISEEMKLPWISTDIIRSLMQKVVKKEDYPNLFYPLASQAKKYLEEHSSQEIVNDQNNESFDVWRGVQGILKEPYPWESYIIEGVAILPKFISEIMDNFSNIYPIFLYEDREKRIKKVIFERGLWDDADKYSDELKEKEVSWVILFNRFIKEEAIKYKFPLVDYKDDGSHFEEIKSLCDF